MTTENGAVASKSMKTHTFANGDQMPLGGLGTWKSEPGDVGQAVREAIRIGYRHIDSASFYGNEAEVGQALRGAIRDGEVTRKDLWITSKLWCNAPARRTSGRRSRSRCRISVSTTSTCTWCIGPSR